MGERSFGPGAFYSENESKALRLNKQEACRYNALTSVLQKEKTLYEKHFKQKYDLVLRSHTFRRSDDIQMFKQRSGLSSGRRLQRRFSEGITASRCADRSLTARKRPMSYGGAANRNYPNGDRCTLCDQIANKIRSFQSQENVSFIKVSRSPNPVDGDNDFHENGHRELSDDCNELCTVNGNSHERRSSVRSQDSIRKDVVDVNENKNSKLETFAESHTTQKIHQPTVSFTNTKTVETEANTNVKNTGLSSEVDENLTPSFDELNIENSDLICGAAESTSCYDQGQKGLRMKIDRFMKIQDDYNKRNPLSEEICTHSELCRIQSSKCERKKESEGKHYGPKDAIIKEVLTILGLEDKRTEYESLPPII